MSETKYNPNTGLVNYIPDNYTGNIVTSKVIQPTNLWDSFWGNTRTQYGLDKTGVSLLNNQGFNPQFTSNPAFQNFLNLKGVYSMGQNGSLNLQAGLTSDRINQLQAEFANGIANKTLDANGFNNTANSDFIEKDKYGNTTYGGGTLLDWGGFGLGALNTAYGIYQGHKQLKLAKQNFEEQKKLNHANYMMNAKAYNNSLYNQQSGRGYIGMSGEAMRTLGREYDSRKAREDY